MDVRLPALGENAEGGVVVSLLVKEGDTITAGQTVLELENEKAVAPIPSTAAGVVGQIRVKEGDRVAVGQVLLTLASAGAAPASAPNRPASVPTATPPSRPAPAAPALSVAPAVEAVATPVAGEVEPPVNDQGPPPAASPEIRRIARELGIDLRRVRGNQSGGRVVIEDLRAYVQRLQQLAAAPRSAPAAAAAAGKPAAPAEVIDFSKWGPVSRKPMSILRKTISRRMAENWSTVPHVTQFDDVDITELMDLRKRFAEEYEKKGTRLTLTSFALKAVAAVLPKHPIFNSSLDESSQEIVFKDYIHIGLAVDTEQGLIVPVLRDVDKKSLFQLSREITEVADKARDRKVSLEDLRGGTFTISNQGGIGGAHFTPIINKPEVAILGLGRGALQAVVREGKITPRLLLPMAISYDHRLIDGGTAARFTVDLLQAFQNFTERDLQLA
jgi:pyruvate dehydrogenase E2 component (dihydrolipoamide acetyltransferase)